MAGEASSSAPGSAWNARNPAVKRILQVRGDYDDDEEA
jgi:hypothetical protein